jgi:hypothetical protein
MNQDEDKPFTSGKVTYTPLKMVEIDTSRLINDSNPINNKDLIMKNLKIRDDAIGNVVAFDMLEEKDKEKYLEKVIESLRDPYIERDLEFLQGSSSDMS